MTITILKAVIVIVIMAVMVLILLAINHIFSGNFDSSESSTEKLREDLEESEEIISGESAFRDLVKVRSRGHSGRQA
ncbi:MAG: hypothetical protein K2L59_06690 [Muribaculaceae bacterium]|nr:hypothetical protein [Muribaculaceae bacterium]